jgi:hypothetical protein
MFDRLRGSIIIQFRGESLDLRGVTFTLLEGWD